MQVLVCGDRNYTGWCRMERELSIIPKPYTIIHGAARGADSMAAAIGARLGCEIKAVPAEWERFGRAAGPIRNRWMLDMEPDMVLAFHQDITHSKGTRHMVELARRKGIPTVVIDD